MSVSMPNVSRTENSLFGRFVVSAISVGLVGEFLRTASAALRSGLYSSIDYAGQSGFWQHARDVIVPWDA
jgi:hypothetical protein